MPDLETKLATQVRTMQIVVTAMVVVPLIFAVIVLVIGSQAPQDVAPIRGEIVPQQGNAAVGRIAMVFGLVALLAQQWMGRFVTAQAVKNLALRAMHEPERLGEAFMTGTVVSSAINEMAAFLNLIAYMSSQSPSNLVMALLLIASTAMKMPTRRRVANWATATAERLRNEQIAASAKN